MTNEPIPPASNADNKVDGMRAVLRSLWALPAPGPENINTDPAFIAFAAHCEANYPAAKASFVLHFALSDALRALGLPCSQKPDAEDVCTSVEDAASRLVDALEARSITRRYLCPLDLADKLPDLAFGPVTLRKFSQDELAELFDERLLRRLYPSHRLDSARLSWVQWLVVEETEEVVPEIGRRALPFFYDMASDLGAIDVHAGQHAGGHSGLVSAASRAMGGVEFPRRRWRKLARLPDSLGLFGYRRPVRSTPHTADRRSSHRRGGLWSALRSV